jgi:hypothetical protein
MDQWSVACVDRKVWQAGIMAKSLKEKRR